MTSTNVKTNTLRGLIFAWINFRGCPKSFISRGFNFAVEGSPKYLAWIKFCGSRDFRNNI